MKGQKQRNIIMNLKLKLTSLKKIRHDGAEVMRGYEEQKVLEDKKRTSHVYRNDCHQACRYCIWGEKVSATC